MKIVILFIFFITIFHYVFLSEANKKYIFTHFEIQQRQCVSNDLFSANFKPICLAGIKNGIKCKKWKEKMLKIEFRDPTQWYRK